MDKKQFRLTKTLLLIAVSFLTLQPLHSQPKALGAAMSFNNMGIVYEHTAASSDSFIELSLKAETAEMFAGNREHPGISGSFTWNLVFKEWLSSDGNPVRLFAGPGVTAGYSYDMNDAGGIFFGLKARIGGECSFARNAYISVCLNPVIASHIVKHLDHYSMNYYKNGLLYSLVPEIGIKYRF